MLIIASSRDRRIGGTRLELKQIPPYTYDTPKKNMITTKKNCDAASGSGESESPFALCFC
jgi:hypothetical protein